MSNIQIFDNPDFGTVRTLDNDGVVLFCATDVAKALGYSNPYDAISRHCKGVVKREGGLPDHQPARNDHQPDRRNEFHPRV